MSPILISLSVLATTIVFSLLMLMVVQNGLNKHREDLDKTAKSSLESMYIFVDTQKLFKFSVVAVIFVPVILWFVFDNPIIPLAGAVAIIFSPKLVVKHMQKKRVELFEKQLPDGLLMVSGSMRAGASLAVAMESMAKESKPPLSQEFSLMLAEQRLGVEFDTALSNMEKRMPVPDFVLLVAAMRITREVGGNFAEILESLAITLRRKHDMEGKIKALTAQGRMQGIVMAALPLFLMAILTFMEPEAMNPLYNTLMGWATLFVVFVMITIGYMGIRKIVNIDV
jgi:tight adherence protein B